MMVHLGKGFWLIRGVPGKQSPTWDKTLLTHFGPVMQPPVRELNDPGFQGLGWTRIEVRSSRIRNYEPHPSHWDNRRLQDLWLAKQ